MFVAGHNFRSAMCDDRAARLLSDTMLVASEQRKRARVFQRRRIAEFFAEISGSNDAAHDFGISRFGNVADEQNFLGSERFAKLGGERVF